MFTGIVEQTGDVRSVEDDEDGRRVRVEADLDDLHHGQSIAINGVCLTVEEFGEDWFDLFLSKETIDRTYLGAVAEDDIVNVERALPADGRFDGHFVQGHVDGTAEVTAIEKVGDGPASSAERSSADHSSGRSPREDEASGTSSCEDGEDEYDGDWEFRFSVPEGLERYLVEKGSVTVDGISLTIADLEDDFGVAIIPATYDLTTLSAKDVGDPVHIEVDVVAKYVESMLGSEAGEAQTPYAERYADEE